MIEEVQRTGMMFAQLSALRASIRLLEHPDLTVGAIALRHFAPLKTREARVSIRKVTRSGSGL